MGSIARGNVELSISPLARLMELPASPSAVVLRPNRKMFADEDGQELGLVASAAAQHDVQEVVDRGLEQRVETPHNASERRAAAEAPQIGFGQRHHEVPAFVERIEVLAEIGKRGRVRLEDVLDVAVADRRQGGLRGSRSRLVHLERLDAAVAHVLVDDLVGITELGDLALVQPERLRGHRPHRAEAMGDQHDRASFAGELGGALGDVSLEAPSHRR